MYFCLWSRAKSIKAWRLNWLFGVHEVNKC